MAKLSDMFHVSTSRPLRNNNVVSISELAQYTIVDSSNLYEVEEKLRNEWKYEIEYEHDMNYLTENGFRLVFKDGSALTANSTKSTTDKNKDLLASIS